VAQQRQVPTSERNFANELVARGWALWRQQRYTEAGELFTQALEIDPGQSDGWNGLGWSRFNTGESDSARVAFERCLALAPNHAAATNGLGQIAYQDGDFVQAERHFLRAADAAPAAAYSLGRMYLVQQRWGEAERWLDRAFSSVGAVRTDEHQRMLAAAKARHLDDELRATIAPRPPGPAMREIQRARQLAREGRADEARAAFDDALALGAEDPEVLSAVGWHLLDGGERDAARELFDRALKVQPQYPPAANGLAKLRESASR
jgi:Flp pilus assembly protein TadD